MKAAIMTMMDKAAVVYQIVLTKIDKIKPAELKKVKAAVSAELSKHTAAYPEIFATSSETGVGLPELRANLYGLTV